MTRPVKVEALNSCSAYRISEVCIARTQSSSRAACRAAGAGNARRSSRRRSRPRCAGRCGEVVPVEQHRAERGHQAVGDVARAGLVVVVLLGQQAAERRHAGAHHVHRVGGGGQLLEHRLDRRRQAAQRRELGLVGRQFGRVGQLAVHQQVGDLLELAGVGEVEDVVAAVVQVVAGAADGAQRGVAGGRRPTGRRISSVWGRARLRRFWAAGLALLAHRSLSCGSFRVGPAVRGLTCLSRTAASSLFS